MTLILLSLASAFAWFISTLAGGGSPLILIPVLSFLLGSQAVPPIITIGMLSGNAQRTWLFWKYIDWKVTSWFLPGAIAGAILGAYTFTQIHLEWLQIFIGLFLIFSIFSLNCDNKEPSFKVKIWYFLPLGFGKAFVSGIIGSTGPILNPFLLNYGLEKEKMIATKSINIAVLHGIKILTYASLGVFNSDYWVYGLAISLAVIPGNFFGQFVLKKMSIQQFNQFVVIVMIISGAAMMWQQREFFNIANW